jgi:TolB-like protein/Flp pilus assembly protein TadD
MPHQFTKHTKLEHLRRLLLEGCVPAIGQTLSHYRVVKMLGRGGMGEVYQATDLKLGRDVALKVLPEEFARDADRIARFQREAKLLASLNHPNIAAIHGLEESGGTNFLVLELVGGETLADQIKRGPIPVEESLMLALQIAEALEAAHEKGVIHRDLKPANIKVTPDGKVKVLDFGLAKAFSGDQAAEADGLDSPTLSMAATEAGVILGTAAYMSPEQARGSQVDKRCDIWSFGVVLFEMLTGKKLYASKTISDTLAAVLRADIDWNVLPGDTPASIRTVLRRCLTKDRKQRLQAIGDARIAIEECLGNPAGESVLEVGSHAGRHRRRERLAWGVSFVLLIAALVLAVVHFRSGGLGGTIDSIAFLPFVNASADPNMEYLSDGITESLINRLSQLPHLRVMSRDSAFMYKGKEADARTVGRDLGVRAVFKGRVMQRGDNLDISAELVDARDNSHIWGQHYSRKPADILALQEEIAKEMTTMLRMRLSGEDEKRMAKSYTANPEAYQDYLKGRYWWNKTNEEGYNKGIEYFQQAIAKDPTYALAYSGLADCYSLLAGGGMVPPKEGYLRAKDAALKALELDDTLAEAHTSLALIKSSFDWDWSGADKEFQRAIELNPSYADAHRLHAVALWQTGRLDEAIAETKTTLELDPLSLEDNRALGIEFFLARQYDQAIEQESKTLELDPNFLRAYYFRGMAYLKKSMYKEGLLDFEKGVAISPGNTLSLTGLGYGYAVTGRRAEAQKVLDQLNKFSKQKHVPAVYMAKIYAGLGEKEKAFEWLEKAYEDRSILSNGFIKANPIFDPLRSDPRFDDLLRRVGLQP